MSADFNSSKIVWKSEYNIGNLAIDKEHQGLFALGKKALNMNLKGCEDDIYCELKEIVTQLYKYINIHFSNEEAYMRKIHYGDYDHHKHIHRTITLNLNKLIKELNDLELSEIRIKLFEFINETFINHIIKEDKKIQLWTTSIADLKKDFGWKTIYSVENEEIDNEHKKLFDIAKEALEEVEFNDERNDKIRKVLTKLYDYLKTHLSNEEKYMEEIGYPKLEEHKEIHKEIINSFNIFVKQLPSMDTKLFEKELMKLIDIILVQHIIQEDRKIITWTKANKRVSIM